MDWFEHILKFPIEQLPFVFLVLVVSLTLHEFAHAYSAYVFGDPTAKNRGRVTLNPMAHLDILGTIFIFIAGFGWAKPVPVNRSLFKNPRLMGIIVSVAGPISNLFLALTGLFVFYLLFDLGLFDLMNNGISAAVFSFLWLLIWMNGILFLFNLIPLPPLDGYRIVEDLAPSRIRARMSRYEHWAIYIFLLMVFIPPFFRVTIGPILNLNFVLLSALDEIVSSPFGGSMLKQLFFFR